MPNIRHWMKIIIQKIEIPLSTEYNCENINASHAKELGDLMESSYKDAIDYEGETLEQCTQEMISTIDGKYGPFVHEASFIVKYDGKLVSAILITLWKGHPLIAYTMTDKPFQGKGLAKYLIGKSITSLIASKWQEIFLVVTEGNVSAERLYEKIGFKRAGQALPGTPPPVES